jgi:Flp pilus assembly protein TadG
VHLSRDLHRSVGAGGFSVVYSFHEVIAMRRNVHFADSTRRRGAAATELALWLPFLSLMFAIALDFCRIYYATQTLQACSFAGAMYACGACMPNPTSSSSSQGSSQQQGAAISAAVAEGVSLKPPVSTSNVSVTVANNTAQVSVTYQFQFILSIPGFTGPATLTRTTSMAMVPLAGS